MSLRALAATAFIALAASLAAPLACAQATAPSLEASVKAAYLYKFTSFVEWPPAAFAAADSPVVIGVVGADAVHAELEQTVTGRSVQDRPLATRRVIEGGPVDGVHMLFVGRSVAPERSVWLQSLRGRPVLIVTESTEGLPPISALNFVIVDGRVRFEASLPAAERSGLRLSSRLLAVAERVVTTP